MTPRVLIVTDTDVVPEAELLARLEVAARLPPAQRARLAVQLRDPGLSGRALLRLGERLRAATRRIGAGLIINDRLDLAVALEADGVHLGRRSVAVADARALLGDGAWISVSCHAPAEVGVAFGAGADAAMLSPIFSTPGKGQPLGLDGLRAARAELDARGSALRPLTLIALGGIDGATAASCLGAGADGVAAIRADLGSTLAQSLAS